MSKNFLEIDNVTFTASAKNKVNNVSLQIENKGDIICLLGPFWNRENYNTKNYRRFRKNSIWKNYFK